MLTSLQDDFFSSDHMAGVATFNIAHAKQRVPSVGRFIEDVMLDQFSAHEAQLLLRHYADKLDELI